MTAGKPVSTIAQKHMREGQQRRHLAERPDNQSREKVAALMLRHGIATGHGDTIDDLLGELEAWLKRFLADRDDHDRAVADAIRETASTADELAFWKYQAIWHRAMMLRGRPGPGQVLLLESSRVWKEAERQLEETRIEENRERIAGVK